MIFNSLASWYVNKFWKKEFILKSDIGSALQLAKKNEADRLTKIFEEEKSSLVKQLQLDKTLAVEELKAERVQMQHEMDDMLQRIKDAEAVYFTSLRRSKVNAQVASDMAQEAHNMGILAGKISGALNGIKDRAFTHLRDIEKEDKKMRDQLRLPENQN